MSCGKTLSADALISSAKVAAKKLFADNNIFSEREAEARHEILLETYAKKIQIESRVMGSVAINHILPAAIKYQTLLIDNVRGMKEIGLAKETYAAQVEIIKEISAHIVIIKANVDSMLDVRKKANSIENLRSRAIAYCDKVKTYFEIIRYNVDKLELIVDDESWPLPKYREMVTIR